MYMGPPLPINASFRVLFHFGTDDGHQCDCAVFDWAVNSIPVARLNFNNLGTGGRVDQGPFDIMPSKYNSNPCGSLVFSFTPRVDPAICTSEDGYIIVHNGANIDVTAYNGQIVTHRIDTDTPTEFTVCELMTGPGRQAELEPDDPP
jgi:hypothetical protein